jgi:hypothetical protein
MIDKETVYSMTTPPPDASTSASHSDPAFSPQDRLEMSENPEVPINFKEEEPLNGVFAFLTRQNGGNPHTKGAVIVTSVSTLAHHPWQVLDADWKSHWLSADAPDQWIKFEFRSARMHITHYTLKTYNYCTGGNHLRSWVLEGSTNDIDWLEIDRQQSKNDLNGRSRVKTWPVKSPGNYRYFRLTQTGKSHCDSDMLVLTGIEFFGTFRHSVRAG